MTGEFFEYGVLVFITAVNPEQDYKIKTSCYFHFCLVKRYSVASLMLEGPNA